MQIGVSQAPRRRYWRGRLATGEQQGQIIGTGEELGRCMSELTNLDVSELLLDCAKEKADVAQSYTSARDAQRASVNRAA